MHKLNNVKAILSFLALVAGIFGMSMASFTDFYTKHFITVIPVMLLLATVGLLLVMAHLHQQTNDRFTETDSTHGKIIKALDEMSKHQLIDRIERMYRQNGNGNILLPDRVWSEAESKQYDKLNSEFRKSGLNSYNQSRMEYLSTFKVRS